MRLHVVLVFVVKFVDFPSIFCARLLTPQIGFMLVVNQALHNNSYSWVEYPFSLAFGLFFFECPMIAQHQTRLILHILVRLSSNNWWACRAPEIPNVVRDHWNCGESYILSGEASTSCVKPFGMLGHCEVGTASGVGVAEGADRANFIWTASFSAFSAAFFFAFSAFSIGVNSICRAHRTLPRHRSPLCSRW